MKQGKKRKKQSRAEKLARKRRAAEFVTTFVNGKQKRVRRAVFIAMNVADVYCV